MSEEQAQEAQQPVFSIQKLYVTDVSLESPNTPMTFMEQAAPDISVNFQNQARGYEGGFYEISLKVTAEAKIEDRTLFLVEVTQAGLFNIENVPAEEMDALMGIGCPSILFPYLREVVSDLTTRAGFAPLLLQPVNFEAIFMQQRLEQQAQAQGDAQTTH
ncbi:MAG: protein-export chaperone SecB [Formivibrio sp.]|nr:protein-export chaperone SecB [Formivibrio sp.]